MIYTITLNVAIDKTAHIHNLAVNELNRIDDVTLDIGGKGLNVSKCLKALDCPSIAVGIAATNGSDFMKDELDKLGIKYDFKLIDGNLRTNLKLVDDQGNLTEINENGPSPTSEELEDFNTMLEELLKQGDTLILAGSLPAKVSKDYYAYLTKHFKAKGVRIIVDADGELFANALKERPNVIKPNRHELIEYFKLDNHISNEELLEKAKTLLNEDTRVIILSLGSEGAYFIRKDEVIKTECLKLAVNSTVGAGDSMVAACAYAMSKKLPFKHLALLTTAIAGASVSTKGTKAPSLELINQLINEVEYSYIK